MAKYKITFYHGAFPDNVQMTFEEDIYFGELETLPDGINIDYFLPHDEKRSGSFRLSYNDFSIKKKETKIIGFPSKFFYKVLVITSKSSEFSLFGIGTNFTKEMMPTLIRNEELYKDYILTHEKLEEVEKALVNMTSPHPSSDIVYSVDGVRGRHLDVYEDKCVIKTKAGVGSFLTGNAFDGEKTIYYSDCIGVQFKRSGMQIGYLQLETASSTMNNRKNNFFNENSFTFDKAKVSNERMEKIADFVKKKVEEYKQGKNTATIINSAPSDADELMKFKNLLDMGIITQEEFDTKKKQILGL